MVVFWAATFEASNVRMYHERCRQFMFFFVYTHARAPDNRAIIGSV
jgi:hypothetical protein